MKTFGRPELLVFVRHAESVRNAAKKGATYFADEEARREVKGIPDHEIPLTERGHLQSVITGKGLRERFGEFDYIYHSGYQRTIQTVEGITQAYTAEQLARTKIYGNLFIRERDPGYTYEMLLEEAERHFPWLHDYWDTHGGFFARPPGGESLADVVNRIYLFLLMLYRDRAGKRICVVTHGGTLRCFRFKLERWPYERALHWQPGEQPENCCVTVYRFDPEEQRLALQEHNTVFWNAAQLGQ